jgi:hypothetical protein
MKSILIVLSLLLYVASLPLPALAQGNTSIPGIGCLIQIPWIFGAPAWWANPLFFTGMVSWGYGYPRCARICAVIAGLLAASCILVDWSGLLIGYFVWLDSMVCLIVAVFVREETVVMRYGDSLRDESASGRFTL